MDPIVYIRKNLFRVTQDEFAAIARTTQATVSRWESGRLHPDRGEMELIRSEAGERGIPWNDRWFFEVP
jgi:DNA-binding transcriptional regulator YiaG